MSKSKNHNRFGLYDDIQSVIFGYLKLTEVPQEKYHLLSTKYFDRERDWCQISKKKQLSEKFIHRFRKKLNWDSISRYQKLSETFMGKHRKFLNWHWISMFQTLTMKFVHKFHKRLNLPLVFSRLHNLSEENIEEFADKMCLTHLCHIRHLSDDFLIKFKNRLCWDTIFETQQPSEDFIRQYQDHISSWGLLWGSFQIFSDEFMIEFHMTLDEESWNSISHRQKLSPNFIRRFRDKLDWDFLCQCIKFSEESIKEFEDYIYWKKIFEYQTLS